MFVVIHFRSYYHPIYHLGSALDQDLQNNCYMVTCFFTLREEYELQVFGTSSQENIQVCDEVGKHEEKPCGLYRSPSVVRILHSKT
jgi:hypothetical protein